MFQSSKTPKKEKQLNFFPKSAFRQPTIIYGVCLMHLKSRENWMHASQKSVRFFFSKNAAEKLIFRGKKNRKINGIAIFVPASACGFSRPSFVEAEAVKNQPEKYDTYVHASRE